MMQVKLIILNERMSILKFWRTSIQWINESFKLLKIKCNGGKRERESLVTRREDK